MTAMKKFVWLFCACVIIFGCNRTPKVDTAAEVNAILETCNQWIVAIQTKDVEKITTFFADDAVLINPNAPIVEGLQNIKEVVRATYTDPTYLWETYSATIDKIEVAASGDLAYLRGTGRVKMKTSEVLTEYVGRWFEGWKKIDGQWKCAIGMTNN